MSSLFSNDEKLVRGKALDQSHFTPEPEQTTHMISPELSYGVEIYD